MRPLLIAAAVALAFAPSAEARTDAKPLSIKHARAATRVHAQQLANMITTETLGKARTGRCERITSVTVRCRFAAYGDEETCRGWNHVRDSGDQYLMWFRALECR